MNQAFSKEPETIHIVFDIDWTLVSQLKGNSFIPPTEKQNEQYVTVLGESYHITDGVSELLTELKQYPHLKISFFSGGSKERNELLLKNIKLKHSELTAYDIATKILSFQDLKDLYPNEKNKIVRFSERYRKPLARYFSPLDRTLLIDDDASFIEESEIDRKSVV